MTPIGDWDEIINNAEVESFVGREQELNIFQQHINCTPPSKLIFYITGQAGMGKTMLLNRYREIAKNCGFLLADCDEQQRDVPAALGRFAHQLAEQKVTLKHFDERYKVYRQKRHEIENDPEAPQGLAALLSRTAVRAAFIGGDLLPGIRKGLEFLPRESIETQASEWAIYLSKKFTNKDEVVLMRDPVTVLTPLFFEDLNEIAHRLPIFLCFDNFEAPRQEELQEWLLHLREHKPSQNIRIAIAGRDQPGAKWDTLRKVTLTIRLDVFTEREAEDFLNAYDITDINRRREILEGSGRLPVLLSWLSAPEGQKFDPTVPTHDIVERFLRWISDREVRQAVLLAAIPRTFNVDILKLLLDDTGRNIDVQSSFDWLLTMPFVQQRADSWQYHHVVRRMMLRYQKQKSPQAYQHVYTILAEFYNSKRQEISSSTEEEWINEDWRVYTLAYAYHYLVADPIRHWSEIMNLFAVALRKRRSFAIEMVDLLNSEDMRDELSREQIDIAQLFRGQLEAIENGSLQDGFEMFDKLCTIPGLFSWAKCHAFAYRGENYRLDNKWEKALSDFDEALQYISEDPWTIASRGQTYQAMKRYEEALADFNRAIALDGKIGWAIASRGQTYQAMEQYEEALADFNCLIALDKKDAWAIANRGETYRLMERYEEAVADFNHANALNGKMDLAIAHPGEDYRLMERYEEDLPTYNRAIALDEKDARASARREQTYQTMERYEEAWAAYNLALLLMRRMPGQVPGVGKRIKL